MDQRVPRDQYPWWVKVSLMGAGSRSAQWIFVWLSLLAAVGSIAYGLVVSRSTLGVIIAVVGGVGFVISAAMYWLTIRWIDRHGTWS